MYIYIHVSCNKTLAYTEQTTTHTQMQCLGHLVGMVIAVTREY